VCCPSYCPADIIVGVVWSGRQAVLHRLSPRAMVAGDHPGIKLCFKPSRSPPSDEKLTCLTLGTQCMLTKFPHPHIHLMEKFSPTVWKPAVYIQALPTDARGRSETEMPLRAHIVDGYHCACMGAGRDAQWLSILSRHRYWPPRRRWVLSSPPKWH